MECDWPHDLDDALDALGADPEASLLAGGTDLMVEVNFGHAKPRHVIEVVAGTATAVSGRVARRQAARRSRTRPSSTASRQ